MEFSNEDLQRELEGIKKQLENLSNMQKEELDTLINTKKILFNTLTAVGSKLSQLMLLSLLSGAAYGLYTQLDIPAKGKIVESLLHQVVPILVAGLGLQQLMVNRMPKKIDDE